MPKSKKEKPGKISGADIRSLINQKAGKNIAYSLTDENPSEVINWIPTGCEWLDSIICKGRKSGIPVGKIVELAGLEASGKSYLAALIAANAQKMGMSVVYFDSESSVDPDFLRKLGIDLDSGTFTYIQAENVEFVLETIQSLLDVDNVLYIWDSLANTPCKADQEDDEFNPASSMARKPRILSLGMSKLTLPIANAKSCFLVLNQLKTNMGGTDRFAIMIDPYFTPGGKALNYAYSLRIWLTGRKSKASYVTSENGYRIGSEVKAKIKKSRYGTEGRECFFKIIWGEDPVGVRNEESIFEAIKSHLTQTGSWYELEVDGYKKKFQSPSWTTLMKDDEFRSHVMKFMEQHVIESFSNKTGDAEKFYDLENEDTKNEEK